MGPRDNIRSGMTRRALISTAADVQKDDSIVETPQVSVPIDASTSETTVLVRNFLLQIVLVASVVISLLGLPDTNIVVKIVNTLRGEQGLAVLAVIAAPISSGWILFRVWRKHRQLQTVALLPTTPDNVAIGPTHPSVAVQKAVEAATAVIDADLAPPAAPVATPRA